ARPAPRRSCDSRRPPARRGSRSRARTATTPGSRPSRRSRRRRSSSRCWSSTAAAAARTPRRSRRRSYSAGGTRRTAWRRRSPRRRRPWRRPEEHRDAHRAAHGCIGHGEDALTRIERRMAQHYEWWLLGLVGLLLGLGLGNLVSATHAGSEGLLSPNVVRQLVAIAIGLALLVAGLLVDYRHLERWGWFVYA